MKKSPCIKALPEFKKSGCPQQSWDGENGCPAWIELSVASKGDPQQREIKKQCIEFWMFDFAWANLGAMEGVQIATEGNRNMTAMMTLGFTGRMKSDQLAEIAKKQIESNKK